METQNTAPSSKSLPPLSQSPAERAKRRLPLKVIPLVFLLILLGFSGFLVFKNWQLKKQISQFTAPPSPTPSSSLDIPADWKTYQSQQYGYQLNYPQDATSVPEADFKIFIQGDEYPQGAYVAIEILEKTPGKSLSQLGNEKFATDAPEPYDLGWQEDEFVGLPALKATYTPPGDSGPTTIYLFEKDAVVYAVWKSAVGKRGEIDLDRLADQILTTFAFPDKTERSLKDLCQEVKGKWIEEFKECESMASPQLTSEWCEGLNGKFFGCESPCRNDPEVKAGRAGCAEVCVKVCKF